MTSFRNGFPFVRLIDAKSFFISGELQSYIKKREKYRETHYCMLWGQNKLCRSCPHSSGKGMKTATQRRATLTSTFWWIISQNIFLPTRNIIHDRSMFNSRSQHEGETVEEFVRALNILVKHCNYADPDEQVGDRLVIDSRFKIQDNFLISLMRN